MTTAIKPSTNGHGKNSQANRLAETLAAPPLNPSTTAAPSPPPPKAEGRDGPSGRFTAGNRFGQGNPHNRKMAALRQAFLAAATAERMKKLGEKLYAAAVGGDWAAARLFLLFVIGRPADAVNPDTLDRDEWKTREEWDEVRVQWSRNMTMQDVLRIAWALRERGGADEMAKATAPPDLLTDLTTIDG
jgi:hypothetical protein